MVETDSGKGGKFNVEKKMLEKSAKTPKKYEEERKERREEEREPSSPIIVVQGGTRASPERKEESLTLKRLRATLSKRESESG